MSRKATNEDVLKIMLALLASVFTEEPFNSTQDPTPGFCGLVTSAELEMGDPRSVEGDQDDDFLAFVALSPSFKVEPNQTADRVLDE